MKHRIGRFLLRHRRLMAVVHLLHRPKDRARGCIVCSLVWAVALDDPGFKASIDAGLADAAAGRTYRLVDGWAIPNPDWPDDGTRPDDWPQGRRWLEEVES